MFLFSVRILKEKRRSVLFSLSDKQRKKMIMASALLSWKENKQKSTLCQSWILTINKQSTK